MPDAAPRGDALNKLRRDVWSLKKLHPLKPDAAPRGDTSYIYFLIWSIIAGFSTTPKLFLVFTSTYLITYNPGYLPLGNNIHS